MMKNKIPVKKNNKDFLLTAFILVGPIILLILAFVFTRMLIQENSESKRLENTPKISDNLRVGEDLKSIEISARSAYVKELETGKILYSKNANESLPLASLTKMMTALVAIRSLPENSLVQIDANNIGMEGDSNLHIGELFELGNLLDFTLVSSSNDGASAIASVVGSALYPYDESDENTFIDRMNEMSKEIGMSATRFKNETGLDLDENTPGATGSAKDMATLFEYIYRNYPNILGATKEQNFNTKSIDGFQYSVLNTNNIVGQLPNLQGSKTGYTELAGGNLAVIINPGLNNPIAIVVLGSTLEGRFEDVERLANATMQYYLEN